jgi:hypothetical protein
LARTRINEHGVIVHVRVSIALHVILARDVVVGHSVWRQHGTDPQVVIPVRWVVLSNDVFMKMATIVDTEYAANCTCHSANGSSDDRSDGTAFSFTLRGT